MDIVDTYRRSYFGLLWLLFSFAMFIGAKVLVFGGFAPPEMGAFAFTAHLTVGFWLWMFISESVADGAAVFVRARSWILGTDISKAVFVYQSVCRIVIRAAFSLPVVIIVVILGGKHPSALWLTSFAGLIVFLISAVWVHAILGVICSKHRDLIHLAQATMRVFFFLTPILYVPSALGSKAYLLNYNPFTHYLAIIRDPIVYDVFPVLAWKVVGAITVVGVLLSIFAFSRMSRRVAYWV